MMSKYVFRNDPKGTETSPGVHGGSHTTDKKPPHCLHEKLIGLQRKMGNRALGRLLTGWIQREQGQDAGGGNSVRPDGRNRVAPSLGSR